MRLEKGLQNIVNYLKEVGEVCTPTAHNKILIESGYITYNKRKNDYTVSIINDKDYIIEDIEELKEILE